MNVFVKLCALNKEWLIFFIFYGQKKVFKGSTKTSMLFAKSVTCSPQLPEYLTVRNPQKQYTMMAKAAGLYTPFKNELPFCSPLLCIVLTAESTWLETACKSCNRSNSFVWFLCRGRSSEFFRFPLSFTNRSFSTIVINAAASFNRTLRCSNMLKNIAAETMVFHDRLV